MGLYSNDTINETLRNLRDTIREGTVTVNYFRDGSTALRKAVASAFGIDPDAFNTENFNPQTLRRFGALFDVPVSRGCSISYPTQDQTARALQNFINRRSDPWGKKPKLPRQIFSETDVPQFPE